MKVQHSIKCVRCPNIVNLNTDPESLTLFLEGKLLIQECFTELTDGEREMLISGICPTCWDTLFSNPDEDYEEEEPHTMRDKNPTTFWQAVKCCWKHRHTTTTRFEWFRRDSFNFAKVTITTNQFPINYGRAETTIWFRKNFRIDWNSEHIASLLGEEQIDGPGPGYGTTYHYDGWLGYHLAI